MTPIVLQVVAGVQVLIQVLQATNREMSGDSQAQHGEASINLTTGPEEGC